VPAASSITREIDELVGSLCSPRNVNLVFHVCVCWFEGISICSRLHFVYLIHGF
jgi:hypothetical protein